jgi:hypothetical protein
MVTQVPYTAKGHAGIVDGQFVEQFWLDGNGQPVFSSHKVAAGQVLEAYSVMGMVTASKELVLCDTAAADGSEVPFAILFENLDTSATGLNAAEEVSVVVASTQMINLNALVSHPSWAIDDLKLALMRNAAIHTRTPIYSAL